MILTWCETKLTLGIEYVMTSIEQHGVEKLLLLQGSGDFKLGAVRPSSSSTIKPPAWQ